MNVTDGPFYIISRTKAASITDGLSQTAAFSERAFGTGQDLAGHPDPLTTWIIRPDTSSSQTDLEQLVRTTLAAGAAFGSRGPETWGYAGFGYRHVFGPNHHTCYDRQDPSYQVYGVWAGSNVRLVNPPTSHHPGGVNVAVPRRLGAFRQGDDRPHHLAGTGHACRAGSHLGFRLLKNLIRARPLISRLCRERDDALRQCPLRYHIAITCSHPRWQRAP